MNHLQLRQGLFGPLSLLVRKGTFADACRLVLAFHRTHEPPPGHKFSLIAYSQDTLCTREEGVAIVGRPLSRMLDKGETLEVTRLATGGTPNVASMLYAAAARRAGRSGFKRVITYIGAEESGTSLIAAGWRLDAVSAGGGRWARVGRGRTDSHPLGKKQRWVRDL